MLDRMEQEMYRSEHSQEGEGSSPVTFASAPERRVPLCSSIVIFLLPAVHFGMTLAKGVPLSR